MTDKKANAEKLIEQNRGKTDEWGALWGLLMATRVIPELHDYYDTVVLSGRIDELLDKLRESYGTKEREL